MRNQVRECLTAGKPAIGCQLRFGSPAIAELFGHSGFDWILLDSEHAPQTPTGMQAQLQAIGNTPAAPIVRLPNIDEELIRLYLDMGAMGILTAFTNTPEEAERAAHACRYPPRGDRSFGPHRASHYGLRTQEYLEKIDDLVVYMALIESAEAIDNIDAIFAVEGMDTVIIGPVDLSYSLGVPFDYESDTFQEAQAKVAEAASKAGKPAGLGVYRNPLESANMKRAMDDGFQVLLTGSDEGTLMEGCRQMAKVREHLGI
ncbi:MAG: aldolase/citrate lyase family protein [Candidatus Latescibacterota bacterium]|nr:aldolase/citrate lyase family protein [Candidatus Latescibacterota bacterium]